MRMRFFCVNVSLATTRAEEERNEPESGQGWEQYTVTHHRRHSTDTRYSGRLGEEKSDYNAHSVGIS